MSNSDGEPIDRCGAHVRARMHVSIPARARKNLRAGTHRMQSMHSQNRQKREQKDNIRFFAEKVTILVWRGAAVVIA